MNGLLWLLTFGSSALFAWDASRNKISVVATIHRPPSMCAVQWAVLPILLAFLLSNIMGSAGTALAILVAAGYYCLRRYQSVGIPHTHGLSVSGEPNEKEDVNAVAKAESPESGKPPRYAVWGLVLGIIGLVAWFLPVVGFPITVSGLVLSANALKLPEKGLAAAGTIICGLGLTLTIFNGAMGAILGGLESSQLSPTSDVSNVSPPPPAIGLKKDELPLSAVTIYGYWQEADVLLNDAQNWHGSGGVVSESNGNLFIATNRHCLGLEELFNADPDGQPEILRYELLVEFPSGKTHRVLQVGFKGTGADLALLTLDARGIEEGEDYAILPFDENALLEPGSEVVAIGSPLGLKNTQTYGRISAIREFGSGSEQFRMIQTDAAINPGNSGGPLFMRRGDRYVCIGINTSTMPGNNLGFAIDLSSITLDGFEWYPARP